jgi:hypothetical protein
LEVVGDVEDERKTVPRVFNVEKAQIDLILSCKPSDKKVHSAICIATADPEFYATIQNHVIEQVTNPNSDDSYYKHITSLVNAASENRTYSIDVFKPSKKENAQKKKKVNVDKNFYNVYIDSRENRLVVMVWNGAQ